jgi:membrane-bound serine protease (ClpP class)
VVALLLNIGVIALIIEISNPGGWVAGFIGVVCLALAIYGVGIIPVNWFGIIFMLIALALFILDIKAPTHGALTAAGVSSLIVGSLVLFNSPQVPAFQHVSVPLIVASSLITGGIFFVIMTLGVRAQKTPVKTGMESMVGRMGTARSDLIPDGYIQVGGESWKAEVLPGEGSIPAGSRVEVVQVDGMKLVVRKAP